MFLISAKRNFRRNKTLGKYLHLVTISATAFICVNHGLHKIHVSKEIRCKSLPITHGQ